jgi:hypothetical protein
MSELRYFKQDIQQQQRKKKKGKKEKKEEAAGGHGGPSPPPGVPGRPGLTGDSFSARRVGGRATPSRTPNGHIHSLCLRRGCKSADRDGERADSQWHRNIIMEDGSGTAASLFSQNS